MFATNLMVMAVSVKIFILTFWLGSIINRRPCFIHFLFETLEWQILSLVFLKLSVCQEHFQFLHQGFSLLWHLSLRTFYVADVFRLRLLWLHWFVLFVRIAASLIFFFLKQFLSWFDFNLKVESLSSLVFKSIWGYFRAVLVSSGLPTLDLLLEQVFSTTNCLFF